MDTNVFVAVFSGDEKTASSAQEALEEARAGGPIGISPAVYAELVAGRDASFVARFLSEKDIEVDWDLDRDVWGEAGERYGEYCSGAEAAERRSGFEAHPRRLPDRGARPATGRGAAAGSSPVGHPLIRR